MLVQGVGTRNLWIRRNHKGYRRIPIFDRAGSDRGPGDRVVAARIHRTQHLRIDRARGLDLGGAVGEPGQAVLPVGDDGDLPRRPGQPAGDARRCPAPVRPDDRRRPWPQPGPGRRLGDVRVVARWHDRPGELDRPVVPPRLGGGGAASVHHDAAARRPDRRHSDPASRNSLCPNRIPVAARDRPRRTQ